MNAEETRLANFINSFTSLMFETSRNAGWWDGVDFMVDKHLVPAKLCLIHSEISEAMEGHRKGLMDSHLPHRLSVEVELADAIIRIGDLAGALGLNLGEAVVEKMAYNAKRLDHKRENRAKSGGKAY